MSTEEVQVLVLHYRKSNSKKTEEKRFYNGGEAHSFIMKHVGGLTDAQYNPLSKELKAKFEQRSVQGRSDQETSKLWIFKRPVWDWHVCFTETETHLVEQIS